jgi:hypothetical protein
MSGYIGNIPTPQATQTRDVFTATAGQTSFATSGYTPGFLDVYLNGVKLIDGTDFTASNGSDVVLNTGAALDDTLEVLAFTTFEINTNVTKTSVTGSAEIPSGTEAQRDSSPSAGYFRFNEDISKFEGYNGTAWGSVGGGATGGGSDEIFIENGQNVTQNYTIPATRNAMSTGPIYVNSGVSITVSSGARWVVI